MRASETATRLGVREFLDLCSWLDIEYGENAQRFDVLDVQRTNDGTLSEVKIMLKDTKVICLTPDGIRRAAARIKREMNTHATDSIA